MPTLKTGCTLPRDLYPGNTQAVLATDWQGRERLAWETFISDVGAVGRRSGLERGVSHA